jgi:hypothetical protein
MIKTAMLSLIVLLLLVPFLFFSHVSAKAKLSEDQALKVLLSSIEDDALYGINPDMSCLSVFAEERDKEYFDFSVRQSRGGKCPGDGNASPKIDRFRVDRSTKKIQWYDNQDRLRGLKAFKKVKAKG